MYRPKDLQEKVIHRLKIAKGHLEKIISMVEADEYCINVIHQSRAVQSALREVDSILLENHLKTCVVNNLQKGHSTSTLDEVMKVFKSQA